MGLSSTPKHNRLNRLNFLEYPAPIGEASHHAGMLATSACGYPCLTVALMSESSPVTR